ncbi:hypothetical protein PMAC_002106 [Pneumocystis sp. 'macacae']|nr:hypothetical protein PMAC_002106 [Pneumocystis sp. 'macacae']
MRCVQQVGCYACCAASEGVRRLCRQDVSVVAYLLLRSVVHWCPVQPLQQNTGKYSTTLGFCWLCIKKLCCAGTARESHCFSPPIFSALIYRPCSSCSHVQCADALSRLLSEDAFRMPVWRMAGVSRLLHVICFFSGFCLVFCIFA